DVLQFFKLIDLHVAKDLDIHVVLDNLSAHKAPPVAKWLADPKRARWHLHFTPTSSSWLNLGRPPRRRDRDLGRALERRPQTFRLEKAGRGDHRQGEERSGCIGFSQIRDAPLVS